MKRGDKQVDTDRRRLLSGAAMVSAGTFVASAMPTATLATPRDEDKTVQGGGYQLSRHVLDYYKSTVR